MIIVETLRRRIGAWRSFSIKKAAAVALPLLVVTVVAACGDSDDGSGSSGNTASSDCNLAPLEDALAEAMEVPTFNPPGPPFDASKARGKSVVSIPQDSSIPFNQQNEAAMAEVAEQVGVNFREFKNQGDPAQYVQGMQQAINGGADVIDLFATDPRVLQPQISQAHNEGVLISASQAFDNTQVEEFLPITNADAISTWPYSEAATLMADWVVVDSNCDATVHIIHDEGDVIATPAVVETLQKEFAEQCPDCEVTTDVVSVFDWATKLQGVAQTALVRDPEIDYMIPIYDPMAQFVVPAVQAAGRTGQVKVLAAGGVPAALQMIQDGDVMAADFATSATWEGYAVMDNMLRMMVGEEPLKAQNYPVRVLTKDNVAEALPDPNAAFGDSFVDGYRELWGLEN
jgi:ribose transport system substrate-binding protein